MVVAAFPLAKIGLLLLKQLSKPVANIIKKRAKRHESIRKYIIIPTGKVYHWVEEQALSVKKSSEISQLSEEEVVELGSNAIGEFILFGLLTIILLAEYNRQGDKKATQQKVKEDEILNVVNTLLETIDDVNVLKKTVKKLESEMTVMDAIATEEGRHVVVEDNNFLDVMLGSKQKISKKKKKPIDSYSP